MAVAVAGAAAFAGRIDSDICAGRRGIRAALLSRATDAARADLEHVIVTLGHSRPTHGRCVAMQPAGDDEPAVAGRDLPFTVTARTSEEARASSRVMLRSERSARNPRGRSAYCAQAPC
jgi:hypothetical protein